MLSASTAIKGIHQRAVDHFRLNLITSAILQLLMDQELNISSTVSCLVLSSIDEGSGKLKLYLRLVHMYTTG